MMGILTGIPAGLEIDFGYIDSQLARRQEGSGRSSRQKIESDRARFLSGIRNGLTIGSPIGVLVENRDFDNWREIMGVEKDPGSSTDRKMRYPRPGHADIAGALKWGFTDPRNVLERASGRTTAVTVALGGVCRLFLSEFGIHIGSRILAFGSENLAQGNVDPPVSSDIVGNPEKFMAEFSEVSTAGINRIKSTVENAVKTGNTLGGVIQAIAIGVPPGLGSCTQPEIRLDSILAGAFMSVPGVKAVEIGAGIRQASMDGRNAHDRFIREENPAGEPWYGRKSNLAGGIEGGISNGEPVSVTAWMKPLSTVNPPVASLDIKTGKPVMPDTAERSDIAAVESLGCVLEGVMALHLARAFCDKFSGDSMYQVQSAFKNFMDSLER